jgi:hypothetical protein
VLRGLRDATQSRCWARWRCGSFLLAKGLEGTLTPAETERTTERGHYGILLRAAAIMPRR